MFTVFHAIGRAAHAVQRYALAMAQTWWRPASCWAIAASIFVSGVWLPLKNHTGADLTALAALVASLTPFVAARAFEKTRGGTDV